MANGTIVGSPTFGAGKFSQCIIHFTDNDYVKLPQGTWPSLPAYQIRFWINTTANGLILFLSGGGPVGNDNHYWFGLSNGRLNIGVGLPDPLGDNNVINDGVWHNCAVVFNNTNCLIYIDGILTSQHTFAPIATPDSSMLLGRFYDPGYAWPGMLDEVSIWSGAFVPPAPQAAPYLGTETGLLHLYHLDGNANDNFSNPFIHLTQFNPLATFLQPADDEIKGTLNAPFNVDFSQVIVQDTRNFYYVNVAMLSLAGPIIRGKVRGIFISWKSSGIIGVQGQPLIIHVDDTQYEIIIGDDNSSGYPMVSAYVKIFANPESIINISTPYNTGIATIVLTSQEPKKEIIWTTPYFNLLLPGSILHGKKAMVSFPTNAIGGSTNGITSIAFTSNLPFPPKPTDSASTLLGLGSSGASFSGFTPPILPPGAIIDAVYAIAQIAASSNGDIFGEGITPLIFFVAGGPGTSWPRTNNSGAPVQQSYGFVPPPGIGEKAVISLQTVYGIVASDLTGFSDLNVYVYAWQTINVALAGLCALAVYNPALVVVYH